MYGLTRGTVTLVCAAVAGFLIWLATQVSDSTNGGYWGVYGLIAGAGLVMAFSQILGGWTKWGMPRMSVNVFLVGFLPVLVAAGWVLLATQPDANWFRDHIRSWTGDIGIQGLVSDLGEYVSVLAFGLGLVFGFTFDTSGPAAHGAFGRRRTEAVPAGASTPPEDAATAREEREAAARDNRTRRGPRIFDGKRGRERVPSDRETTSADGGRAETDREPAPGDRERVRTD